MTDVDKGFLLRQNVNVGNRSFQELYGCGAFRLYRWQSKLLSTIPCFIWSIAGFVEEVVVGEKDLSEEGKLLFFPSRMDGLWINSILWMDYSFTLPSFQLCLRQSTLKNKNSRH